MISSRSRKDLGIPAASATQHTPFTLTTRLLHHPARHVSGLIRLARQRRILAAVFCAVTAAGLGTAGTVHHLHTARVEPLAPAPAHPGTPAALLSPPRPKHRLLAALAAVHPLRDLPSLRGIASWYGSVLHGHTTASGEVFDESMMTACHRTLPFGTLVRVTDEASSKSVVVRINDRGVLNADRVIDLSAAAASKLGILRSGVAHVHLEVVKADKADRRPTSTQAD